MIIVQSLFIAVVVAVLLAFLLPFSSRVTGMFRNARKNVGAGDANDHRQDAKPILEAMLARLQCEIHTLGDKVAKDQVAPIAFDYQAGHFIATFPGDDEAFTGTASISFFSCFSCTLEDAPAAERVCNEVNSMVLPIKCTLGNAEGAGDSVVMSLHCSGFRPVDDAEGLALLTSLLGAFFHVQRTIAERFEAVRQDEPGDILLNRQPYVKSLYALTHAELAAQPEPFNRPWYEMPAWTATELIESLTGERPAYDFTLVAGDRTYTTEESRTLDVFSLLLGPDGTLANQCLAITVVPVQQEADTPPSASIFLDVTSIEDRLYRVRVDYAQAACATTPYRPETSVEAQPEVRSVTIGIHRGGPELFKAEAEYMAEEEGLVDRCLNGDAAYSLYWGRVLFADGRYAEAAHYLRNAFSLMRKPMEDPNKQSEETCSTFYELCYFLGATYYQLGRYRESYYYLDIIVAQHRLRWTQQYVLTMIALGDPRVPSLLNSLQEMADNAESDEAIDELKAFVHRQRIVLDIRNGETERARQALEHMLADNPDSEFAMYWLSKLL